MSVSGVLRDAWVLYRAEFGRYVAIAALAFAVLNVVDLLASDAGRGAALAAGLVGVVGSFVAYAALVHGGRTQTGTGAAVADAYGATGRRLGSVLAASVVSMLGITVGTLLFLLPGLYLAVRWSFIFQAIMLEAPAGGRRSAARRSSCAVTSGRWSPSSSSRSWRASQPYCCRSPPRRGFRFPSG